MSGIQKFNCLSHHCAESCCGAFDGISSNIFSIEGREFKEIILTKKDLQRILNTPYAKYIYVEESDGLGRVKTSSDGLCNAYNGGKCLINEVKPTICKCFPLYLDVFVGLCVNKDCPAVSTSLNIESYDKELECFIDMCEFWISYYRKKLYKSQHKSVENIESDNKI